MVRLWRLKKKKKEHFHRKNSFGYPKMFIGKKRMLSGVQELLECFHPREHVQEPSGFFHQIHESL